MTTADLYLTAELRIKSHTVIIRNRDGRILLKFIGTSDRDAIRRGIKLCDDALAPVEAA